MKRFLALAITLCLLSALSAPMAAKTGTEDIQVAYRDILIVIDGEQITPRDVSGAVVEPFLYKGTTYLPVRAVGEALNMKVGWDEMTNSVFLDDKPAGTAELTESNAESAALQKIGTEIIRAAYRDICIFVNGELIFPKDANGEYVEPFLYNGTTYLPVRAVATALNMTVEWDGDTNTVGLTSGGKEPDTQVPILPDTVYITYAGTEYHYFAGCPGAAGTVVSVDRELAVKYFLPCLQCVPH